MIQNLKFVLLDFSPLLLFAADLKDDTDGGTHPRNDQKCQGDEIYKGNQKRQPDGNSTAHRPAPGLLLVGGMRHATANFPGEAGGPSQIKEKQQQQDASANQLSGRTGNHFGDYSCEECNHRSPRRPKEQIPTWLLIRRLRLPDKFREQRLDCHPIRHGGDDPRENIKNNTQKFRCRQKIHGGRVSLIQRVLNQTFFIIPFMRPLFLLPVLLATAGAFAQDAKPKKAAPPPAPPLDATKFKAIKVEVDGKPFTSLIYQGVAKPVLFPIVGPYGLEMTRNYPLKPALPNEEQDHPHHQSLWFAHGDINGIDFWTVGEKAGKIIVQGEPKVSTSNGATTLTTTESWQGPDQKVILTSDTTIVCSADKEDRIIDYTITLHASETELLFGDTKEGTMALRVRPELNLPSKKGLATITNSEGLTGDAAWGKHAAWVDFSAPIEGHTVGIACFDHPSNLRHPTTWHARDYGLFAANPFGLHDFEKADKGAGNFTLKKGGAQTFKYRWVFHKEDAKGADLASKYAAWAK